MKLDLSGVKMRYDISCTPCIEFNTIIHEKFMPKLKRGDYSVFADFYFLSGKYEKIDTSIEMLPICRRCHNLSIYDKEKLHALRRVSGTYFNFFSILNNFIDVSDFIIDNFYKNISKIDKEKEIFGSIIKYSKP